jgi:hypothetical protein
LSNFDPPGRKTRGKVGKGSEKAKLDKEWNQVNIFVGVNVDNTAAFQ